MIYAVTDRKNKKFYSFLTDIFRDIGNVQRGYNWLIVPGECCPHTEQAQELFARSHVFLSGDELADIVRKDDLQWIWTTFYLFKKDIPLSEILGYPLRLDCDYWPDTDKPAMLHPLSCAEIYALDSCCTIMLSRDEKLAKTFRSNIS